MGDVLGKSPVIVTKVGNQFRIEHHVYPPIIKDPRYRLYVVVYFKNSVIEECTLCFGNRDTYYFSTANLGGNVKNEVRERFEGMDSRVRESIIRQLPSEVNGLLSKLDIKY